MKNKTILLISPEAWGTNFVSKHHYANYLSKHNTVYFLNPVNNSIINPFGKVNTKVKKIKDNLFQVNYQNLLPKLNTLPKFVQQFIFKKQAQQIQKALNIKQFDIVWSFDPYRFWNQKVWSTKKTIYHTVDVHYKQSFEEIISKTSNIVLLSSEILRKKLHNTNKNIYFTGHASDIDNFTKIDTYSYQLPGINKIKAGLIGNFNHNVDYELIKKISQLNDKIDFIFVGPYKNSNLGGDINLSQKIKELNSFHNVFFIGEIPSKDVIKMVKLFDINLVLYKEDKRDIIINPHKMMGYFFSGKITICSWFNEYKNADKEFVYISKNNNELPKIIKDVSLNLDFWNNEKLQNKRKQFAIQNSYDKKIEEISKLLYDNN